ncbi:T3SS effector HopA1 family protein [Chamaesiphon sp. VAR_48_metabat_403]|uniref:T3SS effector HopA1 family protein n=1 Tax=Chamaesiphon sp. VAR_48_metabat_403 TaxID=2964700 RepID=UPI00286DF631|nr:T3SS effector HopA1 family protein [Chamaesiphon sp. VAR_48_metabat_403]
MPALNLPSTHPDATTHLELISVLEDIARNVEIRDDFAIHHPDYKPWEIPAEAVARFLQMPEQIKQKFLSLQLRSFLYGIYYNGSMRSSLAKNAPEHAFPSDLENSTFMGMDMTFFERLHNNNCGTGYFDRDWTILAIKNEDLVVKKGGLKLHIDREKHLAAARQQAAVGEVVAIKMPKNMMQSGFYMAIGDLGFDRQQPADTLVRIYFSVTPDGAVAVMKSLTQMLNEAKVIFSFKVLYNPQNYQRSDAGVLYFDKQYYATVSGILASIHTQHKSHFLAHIPLFTKQLATGLGLAEEADLKFVERESFGINRCQIVADGLLTAFYKDQNSKAERMSAILVQFAMVGIDLEHPYLNSDSENIYHAFELVD